jgi:uncharacterized protein
MPLLLCPNCDASMRELKRNGVALDICPKCRGVWLDRGELETLVNNVLTQRSALDAPANRFSDDRRDFGARNRRDDDDEDSTLRMVLDLLR